MKYEMPAGKSGYVDFSDDEIRSVAIRYDALVVTLRSGQVVYISRATYEEKFRREGWL